MRRIGALALVLLLAACASTEEGGEPSGQLRSASPTQTPAESPSETAVPAVLDAYAKLAISEANAIVNDDTCLPHGDYVSFDEDGLQGVIKDAAGTTVGIGEFGSIEIIDGGCLRSFTVDVPAGLDFYSLEVGGWISDTYSEADVEANGISLVVDAP